MSEPPLYSRHENAPPGAVGYLASLRWFPYASMAKYPHMLADDARVWQSQLLDAPTAFVSVCYDVHLGRPWLDTADLTDDVAAIAAGLTRLRADVVAWDGEFLWIIELKPNANPGALGQALVYTQLLFDTDPQPSPLQPAVLAFSIHPALLDAGQALGVVMVTVPQLVLPPA